MAIKSCPKCSGSIQTDQHTFLSICPHCKKCVKPIIKETKPYHCALCGTEMLPASGIGYFCPNKECDNIDGPTMEDYNT